MELFIDVITATKKHCKCKRKWQNKTDPTMNTFKSMKISNLNYIAIVIEIKQLKEFLQPLKAKPCQDKRNLRQLNFIQIKEKEQEQQTEFLWNVTNFRIREVKAHFSKNSVLFCVI